MKPSKQLQQQLSENKAQAIFDSYNRERDYRSRSNSSFRRDEVSIEIKQISPEPVPNAHEKRTVQWETPLQKEVLIPQHEVIKEESPKRASVQQVPIHAKQGRVNPINSKQVKKSPES